MQIYGHEIELEEPKDGEIITDVLILARVVRQKDDGGIGDHLLMSAKSTTTGMIQNGMLNAALYPDLAGDEDEEDDDG